MYEGEKLEIHINSLVPKERDDILGESNYKKNEI